MKKNQNGLTLVAVVVTVIVLIILAGVAINTLKKKNGLIRNVNYAGVAQAYTEAEQQVKLAHTAVITEILNQEGVDETYNPTTLSETQRLANIARKELSKDGDKWTVDGEKAGIIKITYTDNKIVKGAIGEVTLDWKKETVAVPREEGIVHYEIILSESQDSQLCVDISDENPKESISLEENTISILESASITNNNLKDTNKIRMVLTGEVPIPVGATYITGTKSTGVVIEYKGSEFVWVPVPVAIKTSSELVGTSGPKPMAKVATVSGYAGTSEEPNYEGVLYDFSGSGESVTSQEKKSSYGQGTTSYREPDIVTNYDSTSQTFLQDIGIDTNGSNPTAFLNQLKADYKEMVESVAKYGGFYVGRYETSIDGSTVASKKSPDATTIMPMTGQSSSGNMWYGMYDKQKKFSTTGLQSSMIWGSQYDAMLNWMLTGTEMAKVMESNHGNHNNSNAVGCGTYNSGSDKINNIYDLEGNVFEWTLEANYTSTRVYRGGEYLFAGTPSYRGSNYGPYLTSAYYGSRLSLYIK